MGSQVTLHDLREIHIQDSEEAPDCNIMKAHSKRDSWIYINCTFNWQTQLGLSNELYIVKLMMEKLKNVPWSIYKNIFYLAQNTLHFNLTITCLGLMYKADTQRSSHEAVLKHNIIIFMLFCGLCKERSSVHNFTFFPAYKRLIFIIKVLY